MKTQLFADDTIVLNTGSDVGTLIDSTNHELKKLDDWTRANKLTIHPGKTKLLIVSNRIRQYNNVSIQFLNTEILPTNCCKYLGVHLDNKLKFKDHINHINGKISRHTGILYRIRDKLPMKTRLDYYYAFIYPYLSYNIIMWGGTFDTHLLPLITQHNRIIRTITNASYRDHTGPLFKRLNLLKLQDIYHFYLGVYMFRARSRGEYATQTNIQTRGSTSNEARSEFHAYTTTQHAVSFKGPNFWRSLPPNIRSINRYTRFRKSLKEHLLSQYPDS